MARRKVASSPTTRKAPRRTAANRSCPIHPLARLVPPMTPDQYQQLKTDIQRHGLLESITLYQEGDRLRRHCEARLKDAQARIEQIALGSDGKPAGLKPFDAG